MGKIYYVFRQFRLGFKNDRKVFKKNSLVSCPIVADTHLRGERTDRYFNLNKDNQHLNQKHIKHNLEAR